MRGTHKRSAWFAGLGSELGCDTGKMLSVANGNCQFKVAGHSATIGSSVGTRSIWRGAMWLVVSENLGFHVSKRDKYHSLVGKETNHGNLTVFLATSLSSSRNECSSGLSNKTTRLPMRSSGVHESLEISLQR
jgi:hypothetical protein